MPQVSSTSNGLRRDTSVEGLLNEHMIGVLSSANSTAWNRWAGWVAKLAQGRLNPTDKKKLLTQVSAKIPAPHLALRGKLKSGDPSSVARMVSWFASAAASREAKATQGEFKPSPMSVEAPPVDTSQVESLTVEPSEIPYTMETSLSVSEEKKMPWLLIGGSVLVIGVAGYFLFKPKLVGS